MKKQLLLVIVAITVLFSAKVKASDRYHKPTPPPPSCPPATPAHLPINNGVAFLMVAGVAIGVTSVSKSKTLKAATVKA